MGRFDEPGSLFKLLAGYKRPVGDPRMDTLAMVGYLVGDEGVVRWRGHTGLELTIVRTHEQSGVLYDVLIGQEDRTRRSVFIALVDDRKVLFNTVETGAWQTVLELWYRETRDERLPEESHAHA